MNQTLSIIAALSLATGCSAGPAVRADVTRGELAPQLSIRLSASDTTLAPAPVELIQVNVRQRERGVGSPGEVLWAAGHIPGTASLRLPELVRYGVAPSGFGSTGRAAVLPMGDYEVRVNAGGVWSVTPFRITANNLIE